MQKWTHLFCLIMTVDMASHMVIKIIPMPQNQLKTQSLPPPPAWGIWAYLKIPYFHTSNIYQKFHHSNHKHTKTSKLFLHCREQYVHQCMCVVKKYSLPVFPLHSFSRGGPPHQKSSLPRLQLLSNIIVTEQDLNFGAGLRPLIIILLIPAGSVLITR